MRLTLLAVTGLLLGAIGVPTAACSGAASVGPPIRVSLADLVNDQSAFTGKTVTTSTGTVVRFTDSGGTYYVLQDAENDRVELRPSAKVSGYNGKQISVTGRFEFDPSSGRYIEVSSVHAQASAAN